MIKRNLYLFGFLVFILSFFVSGCIDSQDGFQYLAVARNIYYTHEPTAPIYEYTGGPGVGKNIHLSTHEGKDGKTYSATGLGYSLAFLPAVAITDAVYRIYDLKPPTHFPLESDWLILMSASFINVFFVAGIGVIIYNYLLKINVKNKAALLTTFSGLFSTILFVASKHIYAHSMFTFFYLLSFLLLKKYSKNNNLIFLFLSGLSLGIVTLSYNTSYLLTLIPYAFYYLSLNKKYLTLNNLRKLFRDGILIIGGYIPFFLLNLWYYNLMSVPQGTQIGNVFQNAVTIPIGLLYEGLWGQLLSPGRSFFIYSPILLIPFIFWFKFKKDILPEIIASILVFSLYILAAAFAWSQGPGGTSDSLWHGESSWGPRYLIPAVPFGIILLGYLIPKLNLKEKLFTIIPLTMFGIYVQILGVVMPFQIKFHNMQLEFQVNEVNYPMYLYTNLLPRFSPIINQSKNLIKVVKLLPKTMDHGKYNIRFIDGIDFPFNVGPERWRVVDKDGYILFDSVKGSEVETISFLLINHPIATTDAQSQVEFILNDMPIKESLNNLKIGDKKMITLNLQKYTLRDRDNLLNIKVTQKDYSSFFDKKHFLAITEMSVNREIVNLESIDAPHISQMGPALTSAEYRNWGKDLTDLWISWHIHTQVFERTPNFWWLYPLYYWDIPKTPIYTLLALNIFGIIYFAKKLFT